MTVPHERSPLRSALVVSALLASSAPSPSPSPSPCGTPGTVPQPRVTVDRTPSPARTDVAIIALATDGADFRFLRDVSLVPEVGRVLHLPAAKARATAPNRLVFEVPRTMLPGARYRVVVAVDALAAPPNCPLIFENSLGPLDAEGATSR